MKCDTCIHHKPRFFLCFGCHNNDGYEPKPQTNAENLRAKSDAELAEWLAEVLSHCSNNICNENCPMYECCNNQESDNIEDWLRQAKKTI